jgi:cell division septum initiation protein DivIVA
MTDPSMSPEMPSVADTARFLRRFADLMSNTYNATYLQRAAELLETLTARVLAASAEDELWRDKYEGLVHHANALEAECDALKHDIEGHLSVTSSILSERDALSASLQSRETELSELRETLNGKTSELATALEVHEADLGGLRAAFDGEREGLRAAVQGGGEELEKLRRVLESERQEHAARLKVCEGELSALRLVSERERAELQVRLKAQEAEFAAFRIASDGERDALEAKVASLETKRAELRAAVDRINDLKNQTIEPQGGVDRAIPAKPWLEANPVPAQHGDPDTVVGEANAVVPKTTLRQARAQFEYLAKEFISLGDIASQVMCELGAYTMDLALTAGQKTGHFLLDEVALRLLAPSAPVSPRVGSDSPSPAQPSVAFTSASNSSP